MTSAPTTCMCRASFASTFPTSVHRSPASPRRTVEYEEVPARVSKYAIFTVRGVQHSAPSRLVGQRLMVRVYTDHIECWLGGTCVLERPRLTHCHGQRHPRDIDYRHLIGAL